MTKKRKNNLWKYKASYVILLAVIFILIAYIFYPKPFIQTFATISLPELSTAGFKEVNISVKIEDDHGVVFLGNDCYVISAEVEKSQAVSIQNGIDRKIGPRPNAHDLFNDLLKNLNIKVLMVKITKIENNAYHSQFILQQGNTILNFDARPSDAIAIAARTDYLVPIYVNETLLKTVGKKIC
jgi:bifunctional DNase/RNase